MPPASVRTTPAGPPKTAPSSVACVPVRGRSFVDILKIIFLMVLKRGSGLNVTSSRMGLQKKAPWSVNEYVEFIYLILTRQWDQ